MALFTQELINCLLKNYLTYHDYFFFVNYKLTMIVTKIYVSFRCSQRMGDSPFLPYLFSYAANHVVAAFFRKVVGRFSEPARNNVLSFASESAAVQFCAFCVCMPLA